MRSIIFYNPDGTIKKEMELTSANLEYTNGMLTRCTMKDGTEKVGYVETAIKEGYLILWTWKNVDEEKHILVGDENSKYDKESCKVEINQIEKAEARLFSNPRWGGKITNKFE